MKLRDYQLECRQAIHDAYREGVRRALVVLPTGAGKTVVFASLPGYFRIRNRMLVLAHRDELVEQARAKFVQADPRLVVGVEKAETRAPPDARVVVASVQTLGRAGSPRLRALDPDAFKLIVIDEAHHAVASSYRRILDHFGLFDAATEKLLLGFTATPYRGDKRGLGEVFERIVYSRSIGEMIQKGVLCDLAGFRVSTETDLTGVGTRLGDFTIDELARRVNEAHRNRIVIRAYRKLTPGRRCLVFCADVAHARELASMFQGEGIAARAVWGEMPAAERKEALADLREGRVLVITNCNVLTEGFDEPSIEAILMARPTQSPLMYTQMVGRGTRPNRGKAHLTVIDVVDNTRRHRLFTLPMMFGLRDDFDLKGERARQLQLRLEHAARRFPALDLTRIASSDDLRLVVDPVRMIVRGLADEVQRHSRLCWVKMPDGSFWLDLGEAGRLAIRENLLDQYEILHGGRTVDVQKRLDRAFRRADAIVARQFPGLVKLLRQDLAWRHDPATPKQLETLRRVGIRPGEGVTKGEAALMISTSRLRRAVQRQEVDHGG
jgi:ATP-dependent helicase IRC3